MHVMGKQGIPEVAACFRNKRDSASAIDEVNAMEHVNALLNNGDYLDKSALQEILAWQFAKV